MVQVTELGLSDYHVEDAIYAGMNSRRPIISVTLLTRISLRLATV